MEDGVGCAVRTRQPSRAEDVRGAHPTPKRCFHPSRVPRGGSGG
jgi:hypothetical protein